MKYTPAGHRILVKLVIPDADMVAKDDVIETATGLKLYVPKENELKKEQNLDKSAIDIGEIIAIGSQAWFGCHDGTPWANVGDVIVFNKYAGKRINEDDDVDSECYRVIEDTDVLAIKNY
jgi:co-chaperonin GroES (HSP10)